MSTDVKTGPIPTVHDPSMIARLLCEMLGTLWLVFGGAGSAVFAASQIQEGNINMGLGYLGVALAFGLTVFTGAYSFGTFSGGHFNPAVTIGLAVGRGALISVILVLSVLPQLIVLLDKVIEKTTFRKKTTTGGAAQ